MVIFQRTDLFDGSAVRSCGRWRKVWQTILIFQPHQMRVYWPSLCSLFQNSKVTEASAVKKHLSTAAVCLPVQRMHGHSAALSYVGSPQSHRNTSFLCSSTEPFFGPAYIGHYFIWQLSWYLPPARLPYQAPMCDGQRVSQLWRVSSHNTNRNTGNYSACATTQVRLRCLPPRETFSVKSGCELLDKIISPLFHITVAMRRELMLLSWNLSCFRQILTNVDLSPYLVTLCNIEIWRTI